MVSQEQSMKHVGTRTLGEKSFMYDLVREK